MTEQGNQEYLSPDEAAKFLGVTRRTLERYVDDKRITKYRRGVRRETFFRKAELEALLEIRPDDESS